MTQMIDAKLAARDRCHALCTTLCQIARADSDRSKLSNVANLIAQSQEPLDTSAAKLQAMCNMNLSSLIDCCPVARKELKRLIKQRDLQARNVQRLANSAGGVNSGSSGQRKDDLNDYRKLTKKLNETQIASENSSRAQREYFEALETFELKRFTDLYRVVMDYILLELDYHSRSLESFTNCYRELKDVTFDSTLIYNVDNCTENEDQFDSSLSEESC
ncbi:MAG: hypothetical protein MHMPM18_002293 [Marteilia pararefringens]